MICRLIRILSCLKKCLKFIHFKIALGTLVGFWLFKLFFVPIGLLGMHRKRLDGIMKTKMNGGEMLTTNGAMTNGKLD